MNEMDMWNYMQNAVNTGATQGIGIAILIGLGLWISGAMYNSTDKNIIGKLPLVFLFSQLQCFTSLTAH